VPKIWFRKDKNAYYLQIDRKHQKQLGKTKAEAETAYRTWLIEQGGDLPPAERKKLTVAELGQQFLDHAKVHTKPKSYEFYCYFVVPFVERFGSAQAADFSPLAFTRWLDEHQGWKGARRNAIVAVKRLFNWAVENRLLTDNPLKLVKRPPKKKRNRVMDPAEREFLYKVIGDKQFRDYCFALLETGARPMEVASVTAAHVSRDGGKWVFDEHKTDHTGEARVVYLTPPVQELTKKLTAHYPGGLLFRSTRKFGGPVRTTRPRRPAFATGGVGVGGRRAAADSRDRSRAGPRGRERSGGRGLGRASPRSGLREVRGGGLRSG